MDKLIFLLCLGLVINFECHSQDTEGGHEKWEFVLVGTGDVLQITNIANYKT